MRSSVVAEANAEARPLDRPVFASRTAKGLSSVSQIPEQCLFLNPSCSGAGLGERTPQAAFQGSVPSGPVSDQPLPLSLDEALQRGLRYNLGHILSQQGLRRSQGESTVALYGL